MKTLLTTGFVITFCAALMACGGSSSSGNKNANSSPSTSSIFKSPEGAATVATMGVSLAEMGRELARDTADASGEEQLLNAQRMILSGGDSIPCDSGSYAMSTGIKISPQFKENLFSNLDTDINTFNNCTFSAPGFSSKMNGRLEAGNNGDAFYIQATDVDGSLSSGYYTSHLNTDENSIINKARFILEGKETPNGYEYYSYADMEINLFGEKLKFRMGANPTTPLIATAKNATGGFEESTIEGYLGATFNTKCSFAATYETIDPLLIPLINPKEDASDAPISGKVNISIEGDKTYHVEFIENGIYVDGSLFTEQDLANSKIANICGD